MGSVRHIGWLLLPALAGCAWLSFGGGESALARPLPLKRCEDLIDLRVVARDIALPTLGARVDKADRMPELAPYIGPDGEHMLPTLPRCVVQGTIVPVDGNAPPIRFAVNLPLQWNGRALHSGGGGLGGVVVTAPGNKASGRFDPMPLDRPYPINLGYATFGSDGGHQNADTAFMRSDEALRNWAGDELKKTRDVALRIIRAAYGRAPTHVFFAGESAGGREALMAAQRFPADYHGIIATSPVLAWNTVHLADNALRDRLIQGWLDAPAIKLLADQTRANCDEADGLRDGVIARYMECRNEVAALRCPDGRAARGCLSDAQIAAVNAIREPWALPLTMAHGLTRHAGYGVTGDEDSPRDQYAFYPVGTAPPTQPLPPGRGFEPQRGAILNFAAFWVRHAIVRDEKFDPYLFDARAHAPRIQYLSALFDATDPDLSAFAKRNGKLIILQPSADNAVSTPMVAEYHRSVVARMGRAATDRMMRLYIAGGGHNVTGPSQVDVLTLLESWVLKDRAPPDAVVAVEIGPRDLTVKRSMPACRYPAYPHYIGNGGDPTSAANFRCTARPDPLAFSPAR
jgi:feruloyl esterase